MDTREPTNPIPFLDYPEGSANEYEKYITIYLGEANRDLDKAGNRIQSLMTMNVAIIALLVPILSLMGDKLNLWVSIAFIPLFISFFIILYYSWSLRETTFMQPWRGSDPDYSKDLMPNPRLLKEALLNGLIDRYERTLEAMNVGCMNVKRSGKIFSLCLALFIVSVFPVIFLF